MWIFCFPSYPQQPSHLWEQLLLLPHNAEKNNAKHSLFPRFQPGVTGLSSLACVEAELEMEGLGKERPPSSWKTGSRERLTKEGWGAGYTFQKHTPSSCFRHDFPQTLSDCAFFRGWTHWWRQSPRDPITSPEAHVLAISSLTQEPSGGTSQIQTKWTLMILVWIKYFYNCEKLFFLPFPHIYSFVFSFK